MPPRELWREIFGAKAWMEGLVSGGAGAWSSGTKYHDLRRLSRRSFGGREREGRGEHAHGGEEEVVVEVVVVVEE